MKWELALKSWKKLWIINVEKYLIFQIIYRDSSIVIFLPPLFPRVIFFCMLCKMSGLKWNDMFNSRFTVKKACCLQKKFFFNVDWIQEVFLAVIFLLSLSYGKALMKINWSSQRTRTIIVHRSVEGNLSCSWAIIFRILFSKRCTFVSKSGTKSLIRRYQAKFAKTVPEHSHNSIVSFQ